MKKLSILMLAGFFIFQIQANAQTVFQCKVDGDNFVGKVTDAVQINLGKSEYIQIRVEGKDKIIYLYLKAALLNGELPITLKYKEHNHETGQTPDAELIWLPDPDQPKWASIEGEAKITQFEKDKSISGEFEFVVEKAEYGSKNKKRPQLEVEEGKFTNVLYRIDQTTATSK